ncbi:MAG: lysine biosynthesis protein LysW [Anaerolineae bacterium]|nr:lysine biosynthesis protein LysW [Anaerolineae bacterium]
MGRANVGRQKARCPECLAPIWIKDSAELWDPVTCPECHTSLEVVNLRPLELDYLGDDDWADDEEELEEGEWL